MTTPKDVHSLVLEFYRIACTTQGLPRLLHDGSGANWEGGMFCTELTFIRLLKVAQNGATNILCNDTHLSQFFWF